MLHKLKNDAQIVAGGTCPRLRELPFQLVGAERRMMRILGQQFQGGLQIVGYRRSLLARRRADRTNALLGSKTRFTPGCAA